MSAHVAAIRALSREESVILRAGLSSDKLSSGENRIVCAADSIWPILGSSVRIFRGLGLSNVGVKSNRACTAHHINRAIVRCCHLGGSADVAAFPK